MSFGVQVNNAAGSLVWDSTTAIGGGVVADYQEIAAGASYSKSFPEFAGRTPIVIPIADSADAPSISVDTALGYPRITVTALPQIRLFMLGVY